MNYDIKNKVVLITGANRGIEKALVDIFIEYGVFPKAKDIGGR